MSCQNKDYDSQDAILGNSIDVNIDTQTCESEIRADVMVSKFKSIRLWGIVKDTECRPVENALLKLVRVVCADGKTMYYGIAHTVSDCEGVYQFDLCIEDVNASYKILVGKSNTGTERIIRTGVGNCQAGACGEHDPCQYCCPVRASQTSCNGNKRPCNCGYINKEEY